MDRDEAKIRETPIKQTKNTHETNKKHAKHTRQIYVKQATMVFLPSCKPKLVLLAVTHSRKDPRAGGACRGHLGIRI